MAKKQAPAFQFYANDFMDLTRLWDANACGLHVRCMCVAWTHGSIPADMKVLARAIHCELSELQACWPTLGQHWTDNGAGGLVFDPQEAVRERQTMLSRKRRDAAEKRWSNAKPDANTDASVDANTNAKAYTKRKQRKVEGRRLKVEGEGEERDRGPGEGPRIPDEILQPLPFASKAFAEAWTDWEQSRKEKRQPIKPTARKLQLSNLESMGEVRAIACLRHSTANGYTGLFEPDPKPSGPATKQPKDMTNAEYLESIIHAANSRPVNV